MRGDQPLKRVPSLVSQLRSPSDQSPERCQSLSHPPRLKMDTGVIEGGLNVTLTIRLLMHGKVGVCVCPPRRGTRRIRPRPRCRGSEMGVGSRGVMVAVGQECAPWHPAASRYLVTGEAARSPRSSSIKITTREGGKVTPGRSQCVFIWGGAHWGVPRSLFGLEN